jgi:hypothetical protein
MSEIVDISGSFKVAYESPFNYDISGTFYVEKPDPSVFIKSEAGVRTVSAPRVKTTTGNIYPPL